MIEIKVKNFIERLSSLDSEAILRIQGNIEVITTASLFGNEEPKGEVELPITPEVPKYTLPDEINNILHWDLESKPYNWKKMVEFENTLLSVWNPNTPLAKLNHCLLNGTTLSKALISTKTGGRAIQGHNIDNLVNIFITHNLEYFKKSYQKKYGN